MAIDGDADAPGRELADEFHVVDIRDPQACLAIARKISPDAATTLSTEAGVVSAAVVCDALGLAGLPVDAAPKVTNKFEMRQAFEASSLASTRYLACASREDAWDAFAEIAGPAVVKPSKGAGSRGVSYVETIEALDAAYDQARAVAGSDPVLVEAYMPGREVAVEALVSGSRFEALCISDKSRTSPPFLLDLQIAYPSPRTPAEQAAILALAEGAARALGVRNAPMHIEIMMTDDGPHLVEAAARGAGFHVFSEIIPWVTGIDTVGAQLDIALGDAPLLGKRLSRGAVLDFPQVSQGVISSISGIEDVSSRDDVLFFELFKNPGDVVGPLCSGADRICAIATRGDDLPAAQSALAEVHDVLRIETQGN